MNNYQDELMTLDRQLGNYIFLGNVERARQINDQRYNLAFEEHIAVIKELENLNLYMDAPDGKIGALNVEKHELGNRLCKYLGDAEFLKTLPGGN